MVKHAKHKMYENKYLLRKLFLNSRVIRKFGYLSYLVRQSVTSYSTSIIATCCETSWTRVDAHCQFVIN